MDIQILKDAAVFELWGEKPPKHLPPIFWETGPMRPIQRLAMRLLDHIQMFEHCERDKELPYKAGERDWRIEVVRAAALNYADALPHGADKVVRNALKDGYWSLSASVSDGDAVLARQSERLSRLRALGGDRIFKNGKWLTTGAGAFSELVKELSAKGIKPCTDKSIRADITAAATKERSERVAGHFDGLKTR